MRKAFILMVMVLAVAVAFAGCAKKPTQAMDDAKAAVDAFMAEGAEKYMPEDAKKIEAELTAAMDEVAAQDQNFFKKFGKAEEMLAQVKADADAAKTAVAAKKEQAKVDAAAALDKARAAVEEARTMLASAPTGKGTTADIEALKADVKGLDDMLVEVQASIDGGDYLAAIDKANAVSAQATAVSQEIGQAMAKVAPKRKAG
ncbi:MAG: hypothetical protein Kow0025_02570 [Thermodesulfovibrionales bacterium]